MTPRRGRPPAWLIAKEKNWLPHLEPAEVGRSRLLTLPEFGRRQIAWLDELGSTTVLATLEDPERVILEPWDENASQIGEINELADDNLRSEDADLDLLVLRARHQRINIYKQGKLRLPPLLVLHLSPEKPPAFPVHVAYFENRIELWSHRYLSEQLQRPHSSSIETER